ncbi:unnamed protein product [Rotaria socialis]|uniref:Uncharacterized protein n=2 Tax=Rotaria socialis TaxID=392032 RepID=A0A817P399_9BILA|nr:unnamed protein product [Rotaria socialis]
MFYYSAVVLIFVIVTGSMSNPTKLSLSEPERCCLPKQFSLQLTLTTVMTSPNGTLYISYSNYNFSYDSDREVAAMKGVVLSMQNYQKSTLWIIEDVKDWQTYTIDQDTKKCTKSKTLINAARCTLDAAVYVRSSTLIYGDKKIIVDTWLIQLEHADSFLTVIRDGLCTPLSGYTFSRNPAMVDSMTMTAFVPQVIDSTMFDMPEECKNAV